MIEPTDEMANAGWDALPVSAQESGDIDLDDMKAVLTVALAIVERDYAVRPRTVVGLKPKPCGSSRWGMPCDRPDGHPGNHLHTKSRSWG